MQAYNSIMCRYFCVAFIDMTLKSKSFSEYRNSFSLNKYKKNDKIILKYFQQLKKVKMKKSIALSILHRKFKNLEISYLFYKTLVISIICSKCGSKHKRTFKKK